MRFKIIIVVRIYVFFKDVMPWIVRGRYQFCKRTTALISLECIYDLYTVYFLNL
jgi:hypothetical protein